MPSTRTNGLKDTIRVNPNEIVEIAVRFTAYSGRYMYHCHILEHEDRDMMRPFVTMAPELMPFMADGPPTAGRSGISHGASGAGSCRRCRLSGQQRMEPSGCNRWQPVGNHPARKLHTKPRPSPWATTTWSRHPAQIRIRLPRRQPLHPPLIPHEAPGSPRPHPRIPARQDRKALRTAGIPAYPRSARKRQDRPVTPEVAGSSPVAPVKSLQISICI